MKKVASLVLCVYLILTLSVCVWAAGSVPEPVIQSTESVVRILAEYSNGYGTGSGFIIKSDSDSTLIVTNYHVVDNNPYNISIWLSEEETVSATILAYTDQKDICILELAYPISQKALMLANSGAKQGDAVFAVGFPSAADILSDKEAHTSEDATITDGIVSAIREVTVTKYGAPTTVLQINAAINSGNSGGPLFNAAGEVVGINTYGIGDSQGIFGAIDVSEIKAFLADNSITILESTTNGTNEGAIPIVVAIVAAIVVACIIFFIVLLRKKKQTSPISTGVQSIPMHDYMESHPDGMNINDAVAMLLPVALQLRDMHDNGNRHLQVSPNSIHISSSGAKLLDATSSEADRYCNGFAAPEIYKGATEGNGADIYSFFALLAYTISGKYPTNSLSRIEGCSENLLGECQKGAVDSKLSEIINKGMALCEDNRFKSMQEVIVEITAYNTRPFVDTTISNPAQTNNKEKKHPKSKFVKSLVVVIGVIVILASFVGVYLHGYVNAVTYAKAGDFKNAADSLLIFQITKMHDPELIDYIAAGQLLTERKYDDAKAAFTKLSGYLSAEKMAMESDYRHAAQYADANEFQLARNIYSELSAYGYKDSSDKVLETEYRKGVYTLYELKEYQEAFSIFFKLSREDYVKAEEMKDETNFVWAKALIEEEDYVAAYNKLDVIKNYSNASEILDALTEVMYYEGQILYRDGKYSEARAYFSCIDSYSNSDNYLLLIDARNTTNAKELTDIVKEIEDMFYFEDAAEVLLFNQSIARIFLVGEWNSSNGYYGLDFEQDGSSYYYNLPVYYSSYTYHIENGKYMVSIDNDSETKCQFVLELLTPDSMKVYCNKDKSTYILYRE